MDEHTEYKKIQGYNGRYAVGRDGTVLSFSKNGKIRILKTDKKITPRTIYHRVTLSINSKTCRVFVHRLVAKAFIPNPEGKPCINHIDNNGNNNNVENLEWVTPSENMQHSARQGRLSQNPSKQFFQAARVANEKQRKPVLQIDMDNNIIREFISISAAERFLKAKRGKSKISLVCRGIRKTYKGFKWKFKQNQHKEATHDVHQ